MRKQLVVIAAGLLGLSASSAFAAPFTFSGSADVIIATPLNITQVTALSFGKIDKPATGSQTFTVSPLGVATKGAGAGSFIAPPVAGSITITGHPTQSATLVTAPGTCVNTDVTISAITLSATSPVSLGASGSVNSGVGGTVTVAAAATPGATTCAYTVTANY